MAVRLDGVADSVRSAHTTGRQAMTHIDHEAATIRPAAATVDEGLLFARYLNVAADGAFRVLLGTLSIFLFIP